MKLKYNSVRTLYMQHIVSDSTQSIAHSQLCRSCSSYCHVIKPIKSHTVLISSHYKPYGMCNESASVNISIIDALHEIITQSESSGSEGQQETNYCQANSPLMHGWFSRRSFALGLWDKMGHEVAVICTIKSSCFSAKLRLEMFSADIQRQSWGFMIRGSHWKTHSGTQTEVINVISQTES